jgi:FkbM family methyltransferase
LRAGLDLAYRTRCVSDYLAWLHVFRKEYYRVDVVEPSFFFDFRAHIGISSIYFAERFPRAQVVAVEPDEANFRLLQRNASGFSSIEIVHAALWFRNTSLTIANPKTAPWSRRVREDHLGPIRGITLPDLANEYAAEKGVVAKSISKVPRGHFFAATLDQYLTSLSLH